MGRLIAEHEPAAVVIACNTASTLVLPPLRARFNVPFVGTVPAIKPAAEQTKSGVVAVLATPGTMKRDYTRGAHQELRAVLPRPPGRRAGARGAGRGANARRAGRPRRDRRQIAPCFVEVDGRRTDIVVLACTHYPFLADVMAELAPWPVAWLDPAPAIARRVVAVLEGRAVASGRKHRPLHQRTQAAGAAGALARRERPGRSRTLRPESRAAHQSAEQTSATTEQSSAYPSRRSWRSGLADS